MALLRDLPAEITVFRGAFGAFPSAQPRVFALLWQIAPSLDLDHVEIVPARGAEPRLARYFDTATRDTLEAATGPEDALILVLPAAHDGLDPPPLGDARLHRVGTFRGRVPRLDRSGDMSGTLPDGAG